MRLKAGPPGVQVAAAGPQGGPLRKIARAGPRRAAERILLLIRPFRRRLAQYPLAAGQPGVLLLDVLAALRPTARPAREMARMAGRTLLDAVIWKVT